MAVIWHTLILRYEGQRLWLALVKMAAGEVLVDLAAYVFQFRTYQ